VEPELHKPALDERADTDEKASLFGGGGIFIKRNTTGKGLIMIRKAVFFCCVSLATTLMPFFSLTEAVADSNPLAALGVDQLIKEVDRHKGLVRVEGIVTAVVPDKQMIALVDIEQFKKCGLLSCPTYLVLPILWSGAMPSLKDAVIIEGQVKESGGKLVFEGKQIEKLTPQSGGAK
jgi:hypothetical protein